MSRKPKLVALFEGEARGGLRLLEQTRDPALVRRLRQRGLSERQQAVLLAHLGGERVSDIARRMGCGRTTIQTHLERLTALQVR